jgi:riboflavin-specific deaminase-like protein
MEALERWLISSLDCHAGSRPLVTLSYAQSLDGSLTARRGQPLAISGPEAMRLTHWLRAWHDAILVGIGTILADDPRLTVRLVEGASPQPVILDSHLRTPPDAWLMREHPKKAWIATLAGPRRGEAGTRPGADPRLLALPPGPDGRVSLPALLDRLGDLGVKRLMVEGGASVIGAFLAQGQAELAVVTVSPQFVGGLHAVESDPRPGGSGDFPRLEDAQMAQLGADMLVWGRLRCDLPNA